MHCDNHWQLYGEVIYHAQLAVRYATICQVRPDGTVYQQLLDEQMEHVAKAYGALLHARDAASMQHSSHEPIKELA